MVQAGLPVTNVQGMQYVHAPQQKMLEEKIKGGRLYWSLDKARSLVFLCQALKSGFIGLPSYETFKPFENDFLSLMEDLIERPGASDIYRVVRKPGVPDDTSHAVNFAAMGLWQRHGYPNMKDILGITELLNKLDASASAVVADYEYDDSEDDY